MVTHRPVPILSAAVPRWNGGAVCLCWLLAVGCFTSTALAQYRFDSWTADTGLPQNIILAIHQTRDGYLWVATLDGLARFDGVRFMVFNKGNSPDIRSNRFTSTLYEDRRGDLWVGTEDGYVTRYSRARFTTYTTAHGLPPDDVRGFTEDGEGHLYCLAGQRLWRWQSTPGSERTAGHFSEVATPRLLGGLGLVGWTGRGFWGVDEAGLHLFVGGQWEFHPLAPAFRKRVSAVAEEPDGRIWVVTPDGRLAHLKKGHAVKLFQTPPSRPGTREPVWQLNWPGRQGKAWKLRVDQALYRSLTLPSSGQPKTVSFTASLEDREGNLWLGTNGQGLYRVRKQVVTVYSQPQGLAGRNVYPIYQDRAGVVWIGTWEDGLSRLRAGKFTTFRQREGLPSDRVTALCEDRAGRLWVATSGGLSLFQDGRFLPPREPINTSGTVVTLIYEDRAGALWFGTDHALLRYQDGAVTLFRAQDGLASDNVRVIIEAEAGGLWVGCYGGLTRWREGQCTSWTERDGLAGNLVRALYEDPQGVLWIGTYDSGLGRFEHGRFTRFTTKEGLFNDGVFQIFEDGRGNLWMSSNRGVYRVRKQELNEVAAGRRREVTSVAYGKGDGLSNVECNGGLQPAGIKARDGKLWFPTQDGVAVIDPETVPTNPHPPPVRIESFLLDRAPVALDGEVRIQPGQENFEIQYTALSFINSENIRFKYRLEGLDHDWIDAGTRRTAYYSHLPAGSYTFQVIAANRDGVWNTAGQTLRIRVLPPFYLTWWFLTLASLGVAGVLFLGYQYRIGQLRRVQAAQQAFARQLITSQEQERKRIAAELHDSVGQSLVIIRNWALLGAGQLAAQAPAREELDEISATASRAIREVRAIAYDLGPYHLERLGLANTIQDMVNRLAQVSRVRFTTELEALDGALSREAEMGLYRIVQESLNNILKHAEAVEATITIKREADRVKLTISDDGKGFDPQVSATSAGQSGFGLMGMAERVRLLEGAWVVRSAPGQGTTIEVTVGSEGQR